jgi:hypothetical protein
MSIPTAVFLDTSVLDAQHYNFESTALSTFVPACANRGVRLVLPKPTEAEIVRHIRERSRDALKTLVEARRKAPFLNKWRAFSHDIRPHSSEWEVQIIASQEWRTFLDKFQVVRLGYDTLDVATVMGWYDRTEAPFREGKKRKEFPDAFAIAMLHAHAQKQGIHIAVVSADDDLKLACQRFGSLLYFRSLPRLTEVLLSDDARVEKLRQAIAAKIDVIESAVLEEVPGVTFYHENDRFEIRDTEYEALDVIDPSIVAIGDDECTIAFEALLRARFELRYEDLGEDGPEFSDHTVTDFAQLTGTAKVSFGNQADSVLAVTLVSLDQSDVRVTESPYSI